MISSTRSSESASRSSWKEAPSVISPSSTPSCSVRTSFTRSKTSSRDAAMSPHVGVGVVEVRDRSLEQLQDDVAGEAVGHDDVGGASEQLPPFRVTAEVEVARRQQLVGLERELVPLFGLLADREQPDLRVADVEDFLGE